MKRLFDFALAALLLAALAPLLVLLAAAVRAALGRPVLFRQQRPGRHGEPFWLIKFRTMREPEPGAEPLPDGQRLTPFGRWLRRSSLDELPELWNIVKGDMSWVGPRPLLMEYLPLYSREQTRRHAVRPGLTGWAQVNGRNALAWEERLRLDVWYVDNRSFALDLKILWLTLCRVLSAEGVDQPGRVGADKFSGSGGV